MVYLLLFEFEKKYANHVSGPSLLCHSTFFQVSSGSKLSIASASCSVFFPKSFS